MQALPYTDCCLDVWMRPNGQPVIIDINPWGAELTTGSCLFNWEKDLVRLYGLDDATLSNGPSIRVASTQ